MASFPIFLNVSDNAPLVLGSGELALAKVRLLLLRAPRVVVVPHGILSDGFANLIADNAVEISAKTADSIDLSMHALIISATGDDDVDQRVSNRARKLNLPINVPDRPELSTFALPALVDRGTVTIAIGTEGRAPVLATRLRAELELQIHPRLGDVADFAGHIRAAVAKAFPPGAARRNFWHAMFAGPIGGAILDGDATKASQLAARALSAAPHPAPQGRVTLVGAGPGDADLLTLKAVRALKAADVIVHDGLMGETVLSHARREAQRVSVAKTKGAHARSQDEINALLISLARDGKQVVRLKCGDPSIFGRAGEEIDALRASNIAIDVIPGITAASAAAASLQIPLTHRDLARSITFISGHAAGTGAPEFDHVDVAALRASRATVAVYMGRSTSGELAQHFIAHGWPTTMPVLAIARISQPREQRIATTLGELAHANQTDPHQQTGPLTRLTGPALLLIGDVVNLSPQGAIERSQQTPAVEGMTPRRRLSHDHRQKASQAHA